jgi:signal transduction histidine kinase
MRRWPIGRRIALGLALPLLVVILIGAVAHRSITLLVESGTASGDRRAMRWADASRGLILYGTAAAILLGLGAAVAAGRQIAQPLGRLAEAAGRIGGGDFGHRVAAGGAGEIARLEAAFNRMAEGIETLQGEMERRNRQLESANGELESFSYSVSHDLRAPLRHVAGFAELLERQAGPGLDAQSRRRLAAISAAAREMGQLIDDLLDFSRLSRATLKPERVELARLARETALEAGAGAPHRAIDWKIGDLPAVEGDPALLRQVLVNLIGNAVKYTGNRERAEIEIGCRREAGEVVVFVRDNGAGFDMRYAGKLFGAFQRLHRRDEFEGTGIGLANVRRVVNRHGGRTWAEGEIGAGATFYFTLPAYREGANERVAIHTAGRG